MAARSSITYGPPRHQCDGCGENIVGPYAFGILQGHNIILCPNQGACFERLRLAWRPTRRRWAGWRYVSAVAAAIILYLGR